MSPAWTLTTRSVSKPWFGVCGNGDDAGAGGFRHHGFLSGWSAGAVRVPSDHFTVRRQGQAVTETCSDRRDIR